MDNQFIFPAFRQFIFEIVKEALAQQVAPQQTPQKEEDQYFTVQELHAYLPGNPPVATIYGWSSKGIIPKTLLGRRVVFNKRKIDAWIADKALPTHQEICSAPIPPQKRK